MIKVFIMYLVILVFTGCVQSSNNNFFKNNEILDNKKVQYTFDSCSDNSFILNTKNEKYGNLFIEYIDLNVNCRWNGFERGYFEYLFKETLKIKDFKVIERLDYKNYEISTYLIDNKYYLNLVYIYTVNENTFILDQDGKLSDKLIKEFDKKYKNKYLDKERYKFMYKKSLVNLNRINYYFTKEIEYYD